MTAAANKLLIGDFEITFIDCGRFRLDGGAMFSVVPKIMWARTNPPDQYNRIEMSANAILIDDGKRKILVETGCGDKIDEKFRRNFDVERKSVVDGLADAGYRPEQIDDVINTHLHFDHAGGNTILKDGDPVPTFANAGYHLSRIEWEWAQNPSPRDAASYLPENYLPLEAAGQLRLHDGETEIYPGVRLLPTPGHNSGHNSVLISSGGQTAFFPTDLCPTSTHLNLPYIMSYDLFPLQIMETKEKIFDRAIAEKWKVLFYHDPKIYYCEVEYNKRGRVTATNAVNIEG